MRTLSADLTAESSHLSTELSQPTRRDIMQLQTSEESHQHVELRHCYVVAPLKMLSLNILITCGRSLALKLFRVCCSSDETAEHVTGDLI